MLLISSWRSSLFVVWLVAVCSILVTSVSAADVVIEQRGAVLDGEAAEDDFGSSVALSSDGNTMAIGAHLNDGNGTNAGHVRVYTWDGNNWLQRGGDIDGETARDTSGESVAISSNGNVIAIGATEAENANGDVSAGHVRVYTWDGNNWLQRGGDIDGKAAGDWSGTSVALSNNGNTVAVGAPWNDDNGFEAGQVRVFDWDGNNWQQRGTDLNGKASAYFFGEDVSISDDGNILAVGAPWLADTTDSGYVRVYTWNGTAWVQRGTDIDGEAAGDRFGSSVALSSDGNIMAVGAPWNAGNGSKAGHVRLYTWTGTTWQQRGPDIDGEALDDRSGYTVALNAAGESVAIAAPYNDGAGLDSGHVRVFDIRTIPSPPPVPVWRANLDPNGGSCVDTSERTEQWTSVFVGYRYLPNATDCTRDGYTFTGWASTDDPNRVVSLPTLVDPSDGQRRMFLATNADLTAVWTPLPDAPSAVGVLANFFCPQTCTTALVYWSEAPTDSSTVVTIDDKPTVCAETGNVIGLDWCWITNLAPDTTHTASVAFQSSAGTGPATSTAFTLR